MGVLFLLAVVAIVICTLCVIVDAFGTGSSVRLASSRSLKISMEYIPDGMSKAQWAAVKAKEKAEYEKVKGNLGKVGITKFQSRSFEAWQKSGQKNLFPVEKGAAITEKPYMQRPGGQADGSDLAKKGISLGSLKFGAKPIAKTQIDAKYEDLDKKGLLKSSPFSLPWSNEQAQKVTSAKVQVNAKPKPAAKKPASSPFSFTSPKKATPAPPAPAPEPEKKKFFGLF